MNAGGLSEARLVRMHEVLAAYVERGEMPGLVTLVSRRGEVHVDGPLDDTAPAERPISLRDLLTFRMGFGIVMAPPDSTPSQRAMSEQLLGQGPPNPSTCTG